MDVMTGDSSASAPVSPALLAGERVAFTGTLASMTHRQAAELVEQHGGTPVQGVSQQTTLLVIGEEGWPLEPDGQPSLKLQQAQAIQERGSNLRLLSESEWLSALGLASRSKSQQLYTPAMLSQVLSVSVHDIRRWERLRLITPVRRVMRLPYFDLEEVASARRVAQFAATGVSLEHVAQSLERLQVMLPDLKHPLAQVQLLAQGREVLYRDSAGWLEPATGQRRLPFAEESAEEQAVDVSEVATTDLVTIPFPSTTPVDPRSWTADDWFQQGRHLAEDERLAAAVEAFRAALIERPSSAEFHFHLADALYRLGRHEAAIERYYAAVEQDHDFIEAWTQLGCLLVETGELTAAREAFEIALDRHPDFPDAHFHLALLLERLQDAAAAIPHWQAYLTYDEHGPWAEIARQHLEDPSE